MSTTTTDNTRPVYRGGVFFGTVGKENGRSSWIAVPTGGIPSRHSTKAAAEAWLEKIHVSREVISQRASLEAKIREEFSADAAKAIGTGELLRELIARIEDDETILTGPDYTRSVDRIRGEILARTACTTAQLTEAICNTIWRVQEVRGKEAAKAVAYDAVDDALSCTDCGASWEDYTLDENRIGKERLLELTDEHYGTERIREEIRWAMRERSEPGKLASLEKIISAYMEEHNNGKGGALLGS